MNIENIKKAFAIISGAQQRRDEDHKEFLQLFHAMVVNSSPQIVKDFGKINIPTSADKNFCMELTAQDYLWWEQKIKSGSVIEGGLAEAKARIFSRLASLSSSTSMNTDEKAAFIALFSENSKVGA